MLGGLYGDLPPPSQSSSSASKSYSSPAPALAPSAPTPQVSNADAQAKKIPSRPMAPPVALRKTTGILAAPPSVLRNQAKPKNVVPPASAPVVKPAAPSTASSITAAATAPVAPATREIDLLRVSPPTASGNHLVGASACISDEYDPTKPNDYEEYCRERKRRKVEEDVRREMERKRQEEEERENERQKELERQKEAEANISGEEAWRRRGMLSRGSGAVAPPSDSNANVNNSGDDHQPAASNSGKQQGGMSAAQRMMARMGWKEGQGLGKQEQGITTPLVARKTDRRAGVIVNAGELKKQKQPNSASRVILLRNMVGPGEVDAELEEEVASECSKFGVVTRVVIFEITEENYNPTEAVRIFIQFERPDQAGKALHDLDGRFFGGRVVKGSYFDEDRFAKKELAPMPGEHS